MRNLLFLPLVFGLVWAAFPEEALTAGDEATNLQPKKVKRKPNPILANQKRKGAMNRNLGLERTQIRTDNERAFQGQVDQVRNIPKQPATKAPPASQTALETAPAPSKAALPAPTTATPPKAPEQPVQEAQKAASLEAKTPQLTQAERVAKNLAEKVTTAKTSAERQKAQATLEKALTSSDPLVRKAVAAEIQKSRAARWNVKPTDAAKLEGDTKKLVREVGLESPNIGSARERAAADAKSRAPRWNVKPSDEAKLQGETNRAVKEFGVKSPTIGSNRQRPAALTQPVATPEAPAAQEKPAKTLSAAKQAREAKLEKAIAKRDAATMELAKTGKAETSSAAWKKVNALNDKVSLLEHKKELAKAENKLRKTGEAKTDSPEWKKVTSLRQEVSRLKQAKKLNTQLKQMNTALQSHMEAHGDVGTAIEMNKQIRRTEGELKTNRSTAARRSGVIKSAVRH